MKKNKDLKDLALWDLEKHKDYYSADAMDSESCIHNGLIGNCGFDCPCYLNGNCPIEDEVDEAKNKSTESGDDE